MERTASKRTNSLEHLSLARKEDIRLFVCNLNKSGNFRFFKREDVAVVQWTKLTRIDEKMTRGCLLRICPSGKDPITCYIVHTQMTFEMVSILSAKIDIFATY